MTDVGLGTVEEEPLEEFSHILPELHHLVVPITALNVDDSNSRRHDRRNLDAIKASLAAFGQSQPIIVQKQGMIVRVGNGRLVAARELGWDWLAAIVVEESDVQATARAIMDNRSAELAEWDPAQLASDLAALVAEGSYELVDLGWEAPELELLDVDDVQGRSDVGDVGESAGSVSIRERWDVLVECESEERQLELLKRLTGDGWKCKALIS